MTRNGLCDKTASFFDRFVLHLLVVVHRFASNRFYFWPSLIYMVRRDHWTRWNKKSPFKWETVDHFVRIENDHEWSLLTKWIVALGVHVHLRFRYLLGGTYDHKRKIRKMYFIYKTYWLVKNCFLKTRTNQNPFIVDLKQKYELLDVWNLAVLKSEVCRANEESLRTVSN